MLTRDDILVAQWPAPSNVHAITTTRRGGVSCGAYGSLNLALHVGDNEKVVHENRRRLRDYLALPAEPSWLEQVHGCAVADAAHCAATPRADASFSDTSGVVCAVLTADCLPVVLCDRGGQHVAVAHAGWRGLAAGVIEATVRAMPVAASTCMAWLGPCIGPSAFEVGDEVRQAFVVRDAAAASAFVPSRPGHWLADLYALARQRLAAVGVTAVYGGVACTYRDATRFYSHRRDGITGRMATLVWRE